MLKCIIHEQKLSVFMPDAAGGSFNYLTATFSFTPDWEGTTARWAHFRQDNTAYDIEIRADCIEAEQGLNLGGGLWQMWLSGHKVDDQGVETQTITTTTVWLNLSEIPADGDGTSFPTVNPDAAAAILTQCAAARDSAEESANMAMQAQEAAETAQKAAENARDEVINGGGTGGGTGSGGAVISVNGKAGAVILTAEDVGARPASWTPTAADVGALPADAQLFDGDYESLTNKPTIPTVPASLPNPNALTFTGAATGTYDGSAPLTVYIPIGGTGGGTEAGSVISVNGKIGAVILTAEDVGALPAGTHIPADVNEQTVATWGFTKNEGDYIKPAAGIPKTDLASAVQASLNKADSALQDFFETDPTVPEWAKQPTKPTYTAADVGARPNTWMPTAEDVGALPADTHIPADVTEQTIAAFGFTKNTGDYSKPAAGIPKTDLASTVQASLDKADSALQEFIETDPTVPEWAKQPTKPTYTADEVRARPDTWTPTAEEVGYGDSTVNLTLSELQESVRTVLDALDGVTTLANSIQEVIGNGP